MREPIPPVLKPGNHPISYYVDVFVDGQKIECAVEADIENGKVYHFIRLENGYFAFTKYGYADVGVVYGKVTLKPTKDAPDWVWEYFNDPPHRLRDQINH